MKYPQEFEDYYNSLVKSQDHLGLYKLNPTYYKKLSYEDWLTDKQSTKEFELWWSDNYKNKLGPITLELSFKEVAKAAWDKQQTTVEELSVQVNSLHNDLAQLD